MEKQHLSNKITSTMLIVLLVSSLIAALALMTIAPVSAENSWTGTIDYGDPNQEKYAYPIGPGGNSGNQFFNPGPGPNTPTIKWQVNTATLGFVGSLSAAPPIAFGGKVFVHSSASGSQPASLWAFDPQTGALIWRNNITSTPRGFGTATYFKVDDQHIGWEHGSGVEIHRVSDGLMVGRLAVNNTANGFSALGGGSVMYWGGVYSSYDKLKYSTAAAQPGFYPGIDTVVHVAVAIDVSNPANPVVKWTYKVPTGIEALGSAPGLAFFGGYGEGEIFALDANTGQLVWRQFKAGNAGYIANYYEGRLYHSASSTELTCYNATTGEILFRQDEGGRAFFVFGDSLAYGRYYGKNIALPNSYLGCWDAYTGEPLWKTPGLYNIAYLIPQVADGKMYCMRYSGTAGGEESQGNRMACLDAFTGDILWEMPGTSWAEPMIAYGNLYAVAGGNLICVGDTDIPFEKFHDGYNFTLPVSNPGVLMGQVGPTDIRTPLWASGQYGAITGSAVAANGKVYFGSLDKNIYCVDANSGAKIWQFTTGYRVASTPTIVGGVLYTGSDDGSVYALDANSGAQLWKTPTGGKTEVFWISAWQLRSSPIVDGGQLFVGALDGKLYCLSTTNGNVLWSSFAGNATYPIGGTPCVTSDAVYIAAGDSFFYAFNRNTGAGLWRTQVAPTSGFDIRALTSTPVFDRGYLWLPTDTHTVSRIDAATGEIKTQLYLNYSRGGTMTPAITTPAIAVVGGRTVMYIGDGFQLDAYDITTFSYNSSFFLQSNVSISGSAFGTPLIQERAFYRAANGTVYYINNQATSNPTLRNNVNVNINSSATTLRANETHAPLIWARWLGHQVYSSPVLVQDLQGPKIYFGDDVYSISAINASVWTGTIVVPTAAESRDLRGGNSLSVYTTKGQVFASACIYNATLYMGSQDGYMYAFRNPALTTDFNIYAASSKSGGMWNNETLVVTGRLRPMEKLYNDPQGDPTNLGVYASASLPNATVLLSITKPDGTTQNIPATTDNNGYFSFSVQPNALGPWGYVTLYEGEVKPYITYNQAFTEYTIINVTAAPGSTVEPTPTPTPTVTVEPTGTPSATVTPQVTASPVATATPVVDGGFPMEYVYAIIVVIVVVVIAVAAYMYMKGKK